MSLSTILKAVGKDLSHVGTWIEDGLKLAEPVIGVIDPPLVPILTEIEDIITGLPVTTTLTAAQLQGIVTAVATLLGIKTTLAPAPAS
jgi:hypothetical protein